MQSGAPRLIGGAESGLVTGAPCERRGELFRPLPKPHGGPAFQDLQCRQPLFTSSRCRPGGQQPATISVRQGLAEGEWRQSPSRNQFCTPSSLRHDRQRGEAGVDRAQLAGGRRPPAPCREPALQARPLCQYRRSARFAGGDPVDLVDVEGQGAERFDVALHEAESFAVAGPPRGDPVTSSSGTTLAGPPGRPPPPRGCGSSSRATTGLARPRRRCWDIVVARPRARRKAGGTARISVGGVADHGVPFRRGKPGPTRRSVSRAPGDRRQAVGGRYYSVAIRVPARGLLPGALRWPVSLPFDAVSKSRTTGSGSNPSSETARGGDPRLEAAAPSGRRPRGAVAPIGSPMPAPPPTYHPARWRRRGLGRDVGVGGYTTRLVARGTDRPPHRRRRRRLRDLLIFDAGRPRRATQRGRHREGAVAGLPRSGRPAAPRHGPGAGDRSSSDTSERHDALCGRSTRAPTRPATATAARGPSPSARAAGLAAGQARPRAARRPAGREPVQGRGGRRRRSATPRRRAAPRGRVELRAEIDRDPGPGQRPPPARPSAAYAVSPVRVTA